VCRAIGVYLLNFLNLGGGSGSLRLCDWLGDLLLRSLNRSLSFRLNRLFLGGFLGGRSSGLNNGIFR
jgi:hypothetical protein